MKARNVLRSLLLGFVLISVGFCLGREITLRSRRATPQRAAAPAEGAPDKLIIYYMHPTFRCATCNRIEKMTREVLDQDFAAELADGRIEWRTVNFQQDEGLARRYDVAASSVVLVKLRRGREVGFKRLDEVWKLAGDPDHFAAYVADAIRSQLKGGSR